MELDLLGGVWKVSLSQWVGQQSGQALQYKVKVLRIEMKKRFSTGHLVTQKRKGMEVKVSYLLSMNPRQVIHKQVFRTCWLHKENVCFVLDHLSVHAYGSSKRPYFLLLDARGGRGPVGDASVVLQRHDEDLHRLLHQLLPVVGEEQVVVRDAVAHRVVGAHHIQQRGEQRQGVSAHRQGHRVGLAWTCLDSMAFFVVVFNFLRKITLRKKFKKCKQIICIFHHKSSTGSEQ